MTLAITGSTGQIGSLVAKHLYDRSPLLIVRDLDRAPDGYRHAEAGYGDYEKSRAALEGIEELFMVSGAESSDRREEHRTFIRAATDAGVKYIVYTSFFGASPDATFTLGRDHAHTEDAIRESGMHFAILRDNFYSDLLPFFADENGVIRGPARDGRVSSVARSDVADVAAAVLRQPNEHVDVTYELTGPEALTLTEIASRAGAVLGRDLSFVNETVPEAYASRRQFSDEHWQLDAWVSTYTAIANGEVARITDDVRQIAGHPARTFEDALRGA
jgi:NAD(P)H dehydrogenase (quinone)